MHKRECKDLSELPFPNLELSQSFNPTSSIRFPSELNVRQLGGYGSGNEWTNPAGADMLSVCQNDGYKSGYL